MPHRRAQPTGEPYSSAAAVGALPPKQPGRHRWVAITTHAVSEDAVRRAHRGQQVHLDHESMIDVNVGCIDCERPYHPSVGPCDSHYTGYDRAY